MTRIIAAAIAVLILIPTSADSRQKKHNFQKPIVTDKIDTTSNLASGETVQFSARRGSCDGYHRCRCGTVAASLHGLPVNYHGLNLKMARSYYAFPRTTCHAGAVGIPHAHHVYTVVQCNGDGTAVVHDDAGTYTRRVAGNTFVSVSGGGGERVYAARSHQRRHYARRHYRNRYAYSYYQQPYQFNGY